MWRLNIGEGRGEDNPYLISTNNFAGRQIWEFDPNAGTSEELFAVEEARRTFYNCRHRVKACGDLLWRMQVRFPYYYRYYCLFNTTLCFSFTKKMFPYFL